MQIPLFEATVGAHGEERRSPSTTAQIPPIGLRLRWFTVFLFLMPLMRRRLCVPPSEQDAKEDARGAVPVQQQEDPPANCREMHGMRCEKRVVVNHPAPAAQQNKDKDNSSPRCTTQPNPPQVAFGNRTPNYGHQTALDILCKLFEAEC